MCPAYPSVDESRDRLPRAGRRVTGLAFSPDGRTLATSQTDGWVHLRDAATGTVQSVWPGRFFALQRGRDQTVWVAGHPVGAPLAYILVYVVAVAFSLPGGIWLTVGGGFLFGWLSRELLIIQTNVTTLELQTIGLIIPGLISNWMERQGVVKTITTMIIAAIFIRLILMITTGGEVFSIEDWVI